MALMGEEIFADNILDEPDDLEQVDEGDLLEEQIPDTEEQHEGGDRENKEIPEDKKNEKKKRKISQRPKLNILRLMDKNGLTAINEYFKDVHFKGKGHEREDLNLIMRRMEIWAHKLYPSLQFDDCLAKLEKLGTNKSVSTYVKKIRMGLEDFVPRGDIIEETDDSDNGGNQVQLSLPGNDPFDQLVNSQNRQTGMQSADPPSGLTAEQRERMLRNRLIAEQRRMARMKAQQEQSIRDQQNCISNEDMQTSSQETLHVRPSESEKSYELPDDKVPDSLNREFVVSPAKGDKNIVHGTTSYVEPPDYTLPSTTEKSSVIQSEIEDNVSTDNDVLEKFPQPLENILIENSSSLCNSSKNKIIFGQELKQKEAELQNDLMLQLEEKLLHSGELNSVTNNTHCEKASDDSACGIQSEHVCEGMQGDSLHCDSMLPLNYGERTQEPMSMEIDFQHS